MRSRVAIRSIASVILVLVVSAATATPPVEAFAQLPRFADLEIAPGGRYLAARVNLGGRYALSVYDISGQGLKGEFSYTESDGLTVDWFRWLSNEHLLMSLAFSSQRRSGRVIKTEERRLVTLHAPSKSVTPLYRHHRSEIPVQIEDRIVSFLPDDPQHILVQYSTDDPSRPHVFKINVTEQKRHQRVQRGQSGVLAWMADASGDVRLGRGVKKDKKAHLTVRPKDGKKWIDLSHRVNTDGIEFDPVGFTADANKLFVKSNHEGDPSGLYTFDILNDEFGELIFKHPTVDIAFVKIDEKTAELLSLNFVEDDVATKRFLRRPIQDDIDLLRRQFPEHSLRTTAISSDNQHAVVNIQAANDAGQYMLYDVATKRAKQLPHQYSDLDSGQLGAIFPAEYSARDGLTIPAFITLPTGLSSLDDAENLPFVILPHGGPAARDFLRFSFRVQFLVSRGYGVLQMNFRGSKGYGEGFRSAGNREWGQAMQDDVTDGVKWLIEQGHADPDRIAIVGGSYGGYAALMGAVKTPDLYQCAVSFAGVSDLPDLLKLKQRYVAGSYRTRFIGDLWQDRRMLASNSPARRAEDIRIPILLVHGDKDTVVDIKQSEKMARELKKHGKTFEFIVLEDGDHFQSIYENRLRFLSETERFLGACLTPH